MFTYDQAKKWWKEKENKDKSPNVEKHYFHENTVVEKTGGGGCSVFASPSIAGGGTGVQVMDFFLTLLLGAGPVGILRNWIRRRWRKED